MRRGEPVRPAISSFRVWPIPANARTPSDLWQRRRRLQANQGYCPRIQRLQCHICDFNRPVGCSRPPPPSHTNIALTCNHFTRHRSHLLPFRSQSPTVLPDFDIQDNYAQPHVQIRRSRYRKISHKFRIHTVQTRIPHLDSRS